MGGDRRFPWLILLTRQFLIKLIMLLKGRSERGQGRWGERSGALALEKEAERLLRPQSCSLQGRRLGLAGVWSSRVPVLSLPLPKGGPGGSSPYSSLPAALLATPSLPCLLCDPQVPENSRIFRPPSLTNVYPPILSHLAWIDEEHPQLQMLKEQSAPTCLGRAFGLGSYLTLTAPLSCEMGRRGSTRPRKPEGCFWPLPAEHFGQIT